MAQLALIVVGPSALIIFSVLWRRFQTRIPGHRGQGPLAFLSDAQAFSQPNRLDPNGGREMQHPNMMKTLSEELRSEPGAEV